MAKRETHAERRAREQKRRRRLEIASQIAGAIYRRRPGWDNLPKEILEDLNRFDDGLDRVRMIGESWVESESVENIAEGLRLAADMLEGKTGDGRSYGDYDLKIFNALIEATRRRWGGPDKETAWEFVLSQLAARPARYDSEWPTFSEILEVYREQNPKVRVEDRSLRRSLQRMGWSTRQKNRHRKTPL